MINGYVSFPETIDAELGAINIPVNITPAYFDSLIECGKPVLVNCRFTPEYISGTFSCILHPWNLVFQHGGTQKTLRGILESDNAVFFVVMQVTNSRVVVSFKSME